MRPRLGGTGRSSGPPPEIEAQMTNDLHMTVLSVVGVLAGIGVLLYVMAVLDPTTVRRSKPSHRAARK